MAANRHVPPMSRHGVRQRTLRQLWLLLCSPLRAMAADRLPVVTLAAETLAAETLAAETLVVSALGV